MKTYTCHLLSNNYVSNDYIIVVEGRVYLFPNTVYSFEGVISAINDPRNSFVYDLIEDLPSDCLEMLKETFVEEITI